MIGNEKTNNFFKLNLNTYTFNGLCISLSDFTKYEFSNPG